jgi:hypothetical protein
MLLGKPDVLRAHQQHSVLMRTLPAQAALQRRYAPAAKGEMILPLRLVDLEFAGLFMMDLKAAGF